jgi:ribonuclease VapC
MSVVLLDASAVLAFLQGEPGEEVVRHALQTQPCAITAANQCEVIAKALDRGITRPALESILAALGTSVIDILAADGAAAGWMRPATRALGLSLGDRLCLAAAQRLAAPVLTADRPWLALAEPLGVDIRCIRPDAH